MEAQAPQLPVARRVKKTVCPCCGFKFQGQMSSGCHQCGVRSVGEPLARPDRELPYLGRGLFVAAMGAILLLTLVAITVLGLIQTPPASLGFWTIMGAAEAAVWEFKFMLIPASLVALWASRKIWSGIRRQPTRFVGGLPMHLGFATTAFCAVAFLAMIGVTIPDRIHTYRLSVDAEQFARAYAYDRILLEYRGRFGTLPTVPADLRKLPDPDGVIADLLKDSDQATYRPWTELATTSPQKMNQGRLNSPRIRPASLTDSGSDETSGETVSFTSYELRTPGADKVYGTEDDMVIRDGIVEKAGKPVDKTRNGSADQTQLR